LSEPIYYYHIIGSAMILIGVYGTVLAGKKTQSVNVSTSQNEPD